MRSNPLALLRALLRTRARTCTNSRHRALHTCTRKRCTRPSLLRCHRHHHARDPAPSLHTQTRSNTPCAPSFPDREKVVSYFRSDTSLRRMQLPAVYRNESPLGFRCNAPARFFGDGRSRDAFVRRSSLDPLFYAVLVLYTLLAVLFCMLR